MGDVLHVLARQSGHSQMLSAQTKRAARAGDPLEVLPVVGANYGPDGLLAGVGVLDAVALVLERAAVSTLGGLPAVLLAVILGRGDGVWLEVVGLAVERHELVAVAQVNYLLLDRMPSR